MIITEYGNQVHFLTMVSTASSTQGKAQQIGSALETHELPDYACLQCSAKHAPEFSEPRHFLGKK